MVERGRGRAGNALAAWAAVLLVAAGLAWGVGAASAQVDRGAGDATRGEGLYTLNCTPCHSPDGRGGETPDGRAAPAIDDVSIAYARLVLVTHRMPPGEDPFDNRERPRRFTEQEMADVLAYMVRRFDLTGEVPEPPSGDAARGQALFARHCAACHGATGAGGVAGAGAWTPSINAYPPRVIAAAVRVGPFEMPQFPPGVLDDADVGDIAAFLAEVDAEPGTLLFPGELNPVYASAFGALLTLAVLALVLVVSGKPLWLPDRDQDPDPDTDGPDRTAGGQP